MKSKIIIHNTIFFQSGFKNSFTVFQLIASLQNLDNDELLRFAQWPAFSYFNHVADICIDTIWFVRHNPAVSTLVTFVFWKELQILPLYYSCTLCLCRDQTAFDYAPAHRQLTMPWAFWVFALPLRRHGFYSNVARFSSFPSCHFFTIVQISFLSCLQACRQAGCRRLLL